jgi:hypothetical protein
VTSAEESRLPALVRAFGLALDQFEGKSIYEFGPVFRGRSHGCDIVLKRTRSPMAHALEIRRWTGALVNSGVPVVTAEPRVDGTPREVDGEIWVAYPFVYGRSYLGSADDIGAAGRLLGAIHAASPDPQQVNLPAFSFDDAIPDADDLSGFRSVVARTRLDDAERIVRQSDVMIERVRSEAAAGLVAELPTVVGVWDFKSNNLVYVEGELPVLVDPDSAGLVPRVADLALAALLFHNAQESAPGRMFTTEEWDWFLHAYLEYVEVTDLERDAWRMVLETLWLDEGIWLMTNDEAGWTGGRQRDFLLDLLLADLGRFRF